MCNEKSLPCSLPDLAEVSAGIGSRPSVIPCFYFTSKHYAWCWEESEALSAISPDSTLYPTSLNSLVIENLFGWTETVHKDTISKDTQTSRGKVNLWLHAYPERLRLGYPTGYGWARANLLEKRKDFENPLQALLNCSMVRFILPVKNNGYHWIPCWDDAQKLFRFQVRLPIVSAYVISCTLPYF